MLTRLWRLPLWAHAAAFALILLVWLPLSAPRSAFTSDEGAYALEAAALRDGHWEYEYRLAELDPEGDRFPVVLTPRSADGRWYPYVHHPLYPLLLSGVTSAIGETAGLHALALLGAVAAACAAWLLALEIEARAARPAFWLVASGPVAINGALGWAHVPSAALAGMALLYALRIGRGRATVTRLSPASKAGGLLVLCALVVLGVLLRSEGLFVAGAAAVVLTVAARRVRLVAALPIAAGLVAWAAERQWIDSIVSEYLAPNRTDGVGSGFVADRVGGAWHVLFGGSYEGQDVALVFSLAALLVVIVFGFEGSADRVAPAAAMAAVLLGLRLVLAPDDSVTGLLAAWPLMLLGLLLAVRKAGGPAVALLLGSGAFVAAVLATQYAEGGGLEWGGRFLAPIAAPLAAVAAVGLCRVSGRAVVASVALGAVTAAMGVGIVTDKRRDHDRLIAAIERRDPEVVVTTIPALPRLAWRTHDDMAWWLVEEDAVADAVADLERSGRTNVITVTEDGIKNTRS